MYEEQDNIKIVICAPTAKNEIASFLEEDLGIERENIVLTYSEHRINCSHIDAMLGISRGEKTLVKMREASEDEDCDKTILVLGGSTSDPYFDRIHSWAYFLNKLLKKHKIRIMNGAVVGYSTSQELLELLRDGLGIYPDVVISYSGVNDYSPGNELEDGSRFSYMSRNLYSTFNRLIDNYERDMKKLPPVYYGERYSDGFDIYLRNMRMMHAICEEFGIAFFGIFQPVLWNQLIEKDSIADKLSKEPIAVNFFNRFNKFYNRFERIKKDYPYLVDFTDIFKHSTDVFSDTCHTNEKGNKIIAQNMYELLRGAKVVS